MKLKIKCFLKLLRGHSLTIHKESKCKKELIGYVIPNSIFAPKYDIRLINNLIYTLEFLAGFSDIRKNCLHKVLTFLRRLFYVVPSFRTPPPPHLLVIFILLLRTIIRICIFKIYWISTPLIVRIIKHRCT